MSAVDKSKPVLVTGATGYLASWVVKYLLDDGMTVHATVRDKSNTRKYSHLSKAADQSKGNLIIFEADLLKPGTFDKAAQDCDLVIHTASPFLTGRIKDPENSLVKPALEGTKNVLNAASATNVKRVVLTSSVAAIYSDNVDVNKTEKGKLNEEHWNTESSLTHNAYSYSKTLAEQEAWNIAKSQDQWTLTTINPSFILGPSLSQRKDSVSIDFMASVGNGKFRTGLPAIYFGVVDVRDAARAHITAGLNESASGRHILSNKTMKMMEIVDLLKSRFGRQYPFPMMQAPNFMLYILGPMQGFTWKYIKRNVGIPVEFDNSYSKKDLMVNYRPVEETILEQFEQLRADGILSK